MRPDYVVYIGRFQPFHYGHYHALTQALSAAGHVIVVLGSSGGPRTVKNPWTAEERETMIRACLTEYENRKVTFVPIEDSSYNDGAWAASVVEAVDEIVLSDERETLPTVALIGHEKDDSTYYLRMFPQWKFIEVGAYKDNGGNKTAATDIRRGFLTFAADWTNSQHLPKAVGVFLNEFARTDDYKALVKEKVFIDVYKASWSVAPYPPTFVTVDAVVVQSNHVLLVQRRAEPGKGLWALPGGFLDQGERIIDGTIRELREETRLKVPEAVLRGNIVTTKVFDDPGRSLRGRTITHASLIHLPAQVELPPVKAASDASKAQWWQITDVKRSMMFEDHMDIIRNLTAVL